jgi:hypothetical protein
MWSFMSSLGLWSPAARAMVTSRQGYGHQPPGLWSPAIVIDARVFKINSVGVEWSVCVFDKDVKTEFLS